MLGYQGNEDIEQPSVVADLNQQENKNDESDSGEERSDKESGMNEDYDATFANLKGRQKRLFELRMKMVSCIIVKHDANGFFEVLHGT